MTDKQMNQRIAEACGWTDFRDGVTGKAPGEQLDRVYFIPSYCGNLNAMAEAESTMTQLQWAYFVAKLAELTRQPGRCDIPAQILLQATSRQRAEAFLKAVEKWEAPK
jgi:hypothetical protein